MGSNGKMLISTCILSFLLGSVLLSSMISTTEARPLQASGLHRNAIRESKGLSWRSFFLGAKKTSGPSPGIGHKYIHVQKLRGVMIKNSGPSPGEGHKTVNGNKH